MFRIFQLMALIVVFFLPGISNCQVNLTNGLVAHYTFSGNANDVSGNGHNGVLVNGPSLATDRFGNANSAYSFDGIDDYIRVTDNGAFSTSQVSISFWFKTNSDNLQNLIGKRKFNDDGTPAGGAQYQFFINYSLFPGIGSNIVGANGNSCTNITSSSYVNTNNIICKNKWYHAVITFDGVAHKIYIDGVLKLTSATGFNAMLSCLSELRFGVWWAAGTIPFSGTMDDIRWYNRPLNQDEVTALYDNFPVSSSADFNYSQSSCDPRTIRFNNLTPNVTSLAWDFGNSTTNNGSATPLVTYASYGVYNVKLKVQTGSGCLDSVTKSIPVTVQKDSLITKADTTICKGASVQLNTLPSLSYCWGTAAGLNNTNIANPVATPASTTTYYFTAEAQGNNLVVNGDFSSGNTGFTSDYSYSMPTNTAAAQYGIGTNPTTWWFDFPSCGDHTTGSGNMMMVNGSQTIGSKVWQQVIPVVPNTNYAFSTWIKSLHSLSPANLKFSINSNTLGDNILASATTCNWKQFYTTWNSGSNTTATITIVNNNTAFSGNDFALDDISFSEVFLKQDSITITVVDPPVLNISGNVTICSGQSTQLSVSGASHYVWSPAQSLSNANIANPIASPSNTTLYAVSAYDQPGCTSNASVTVTINPKVIPDFSYSQNVCSPLTIQFNNISPSVTSIQWDFGNSTSNIGNSNPVVTYAAYGVYPVKMKVVSSAVCIDSAVKLIPVMVTVDSLITRADTSICKGNSVQLNTLPSLDFCWTPSAGLNNAANANPVATPTSTTTYYFTSKVKGPELIINGDFSAGNTGFTSDYVYSMPTNTAGAQYGIGGNPNTWWPTFPACGDHTTGSGNMMMVNGSSVAGAKVWQQFITVAPNTNYAFSSWVKSLHATNPANLRFSINGNALGNNSLASAVTCDWKQFYTTWNSGNNNVAVITIVNNNTILSGNDFALDDISFAEVLLKRDSLNIGVDDEPDITLPANTEICKGQSVSLTASGATYYSWSPSTSLSNANISNPTASPVNTTKYYVSGYNVPGCIGRDSITITVKDTPTISTITDTGFCRGTTPITIFASAAGAAQYVWTPSTGLTDPNASATVANPLNTQTYRIEVTGTNGCKSYDSVKVEVLDQPIVDTRSDTSVCTGIQTLLTTNATNATTYSWSPVIGLSNPNIASPLALPSVLTKYILTASNGKCLAKDSVTIDLKPLPVITKSLDTTICNGGAANLLVTGGTSYQWSPALGLNSTTIGNPVASPSVPTKYYVTVTGANGCDKRDSIIVGWVPRPSFSITPSAIAICIGDSIRLTAAGADTYHWYQGSNIITPNNAATFVHPNATQQFAVAVSHVACRINDTLRSTVTVNDLPVATASKSNDIDCSNATATLAATGGVNYSWSPQNGITGGNTANPTVSPAATTTYYVNVTNANGCSDIDSVKVNVLFNPASGGYYMANAFTPNNDGKNDCYGLKFWGIVQDLDFSIYNRWGEKVFHTSDASGCWDGTYKGIAQASGTYVYQVKAKTACGNVYRKGTVILMR